MKRITIYEDDWGPNYLKSPNTGKMCCLGFACHQLGALEHEVVGLQMPGDLRLLVELSSEELNQFISACGKQVSNELGTEYDQLLNEDAGYPPPIVYGDLLARTNDWYHRKRSKKAEVRSKVQALLRKGFKEMGYQLVFKEGSQHG